MEVNLRVVREANTLTGMHERRHRAFDTANVTLIPELHKIRNDLDLMEQELRRSARKLEELESKLSPAPSVKSAHGDSESSIRDLTNSLREAERVKVIYDGKAATISALARELRSVNQF